MSALDVEVEGYAVDAKYRQVMSVFEWYEKLKKDAKKLYPKERRIPLLILKEAKRRGECAVLSLDDFILLTGGIDLKEKLTFFRECTRCHEVYPQNEEYFPIDRQNKSGLSWRCHECNKELSKKWREENKERYKHTLRNCALQEKYGISEEDYLQMLDDQSGVCAICGQEESRQVNGTPTLLCVDHNHNTGKVRGLLCHSCNTALGMLREDIDNFKAAIDYLQKEGDQNE